MRAHACVPILCAYALARALCVCATSYTVPTACPLDPTELDCFECGCSIASVTIGNAIAAGYVTEEYLLGENSTAVNDILACSIQLLPQLEAVNLSLINLLPLIGCTELTEDTPAAIVCIEAKLRAAEEAGAFTPELDMMPDTELEPEMEPEMEPDMEPDMEPVPEDCSALTGPDGNSPGRYDDGTCCCPPVPMSGCGQACGVVPGSGGGGGGGGGGGSDP